MANFNPNAAFLIGEEWPPVLPGAVTLDSITKGACQSIAQTTVQNIGSAKVYVGSIPAHGGVYAVEVFDAENAVPTGLTSSLFARPNADKSNSGWTGVPNNSGNLYTNIDEAVLDASDYITAATPPVGQLYKMNFALPTLTGKRVLAVRLVANAEVQGASGGSELSLYMVRVGAYASLIGNSFLFWSGAGATTLTSAWITNNGDSRSPGVWTIADLNDFAANSYVAAEFDAGIGIEGSPPSAGTAFVYQVYLEILVCDETRLAIGKLDDYGYSSLTANAWNTATLATPTGGTWAKDGTGRHLYLIRRITPSGSISIPTLASASGAPPNPASGFSPTLNPSYGYASAMNPSTGAVFGLVQQTTAPADSVDSQPYVLQVEAKVYNGQTARQQFTSGGAVTVAGITARVKGNSAAGDLNVKLKRASDDVQLGTTVVLTAAAFAALPIEGNGWKILSLTMGTPATLAAVQYYLEFSDTNGTDDGTGTKYWSVLTLDDVSVGDIAGFGGTTDAATINGARATRYDMPATVAVIPVAPGSFAASVVQQALPVPALASTEGCEVPHADYVHLTWTVTSLGVAFLRYEIQRSDDGGTTWGLVAMLTAESLNYWNDHEALRGVQECYRIRSVRADGTPSAWSSNVCATCQPVSCELLFVSNSDPTLTVAYGRPPSVVYKVLDAAAMVLASMYGRNRQVAFLPTERQGVSFDVTVYVNLLATPLATGVAAFNTLRTLAEAQGLTIPYVCVLDHEGNRFYAAIQVNTGTQTQPFNHQVAALTVTEVRDTVLAVTVALV